LSSIGGEWQDKLRGSEKTIRRYLEEDDRVEAERPHRADEEGQRAHEKVRVDRGNAQQHREACPATTQHDGWSIRIAEMKRHERVIRALLRRNGSRDKHVKFYGTTGEGKKEQERM
jgi:hypothetical protein